MTITTPAVTSLEQAVAMGRSLPLTVRPGPHEPDLPLAPGVGVAFRLGGEETGGQVAVVEHPFAVGALVPPHVHTLEDEFSIVTAGLMGFRSGSDEVVLGPGGYISKPRGELHAMWNAGNEEARIIEVITPAGFEGFFRELSGMVGSGPPDPEEIGRLAAAYGLFFDDAWVPELTAKYHLTPRG